MDIDAFLKGWGGTVVASDNSNRSFCVFSLMLFFLGVRKAGKGSATGNPLFEATAGFGCLVVHAAFLRQALDDVYFSSLEISQDIDGSCLHILQNIFTSG